MPKQSVNLNHIAYADDTSSDTSSLELIMETFKAYEEVSGQKINREKSAFYMFRNVAAAQVEDVERVTVMSKESFPSNIQDVLYFIQGRRTAIRMS